MSEPLNASVTFRTTQKNARKLQKITKGSDVKKAAVLRMGLDYVLGLEDPVAAIKGRLFQGGAR